MKKVNQKSNKKLAVIYCRTATVEKDTISRLNEQERVCKKAVKDDGVKLLKIIKDIGESGASLKRSGIQEVMRMANNGSIDAVYTTESDRISRNTLDYLNLKKLFQDNNVLLKHVYQPMPKDSAASMMMDAIKTSFNKLQRIVTVEKTKKRKPKIMMTYCRVATEDTGDDCINIFSAMAEYECKQRSERIKRGIARKKALASN